MSCLVLNHGYDGPLVACDSLHGVASIDCQQCQGSREGAGESNRGVFHGPFPHVEAMTVYKHSIRAEGKGK
jgi:hypothetical protein